MRDFGSMSHPNRRKLFERAAFERFCAVREIEIVAGTFSQPDSPAPDILCAIVGEEGPTAFELVCLDDAAFQQRFNLMSDSHALMTHPHQSLDATRREAFDAAFGDAHLSVHFVASAGKRTVRRSMPGLFEALMRLQPGVTGPVLDEQSTSPEGVERVYIGREPSFHGPEFSTPSGGFVAPLNLTKLENKLGKTYQSEAPIELLAYAARISRDSDEKTIPEILNRLMPKSSFRRVWIFEDLERRATCYER